MNSILIIDDDVEICLLLSRFLTKNSYQVETAQRGATGIEKLTLQPYDVVLSDFRLGDMDGRQILEKIKEIRPAVPVIIITGYSDIKIAVDVMKLGAFDYITKPLIPEEVLNLVKKALEIRPSEDIEKKNGTILTGAKEEKKEKTDGIVVLDEEYLKSSSPESNAIYKQIELVAPTNYSVILYGESGTGKEVLARMIHTMSSRGSHPFIAMDCGTLTKELAGSELFGHEKGSFTGAIMSKAGHFELANKGTLFLDEVANLPYDVQATLLRVMQERRIKRIGGIKEIEVDIRIIIASNENLQEAFKKGKFREDLYHRFNEFSIDLPPLRLRKKDIMDFAHFFLRKANRELGKNIEGFDDEVKEIFLNYSWPGNLRELRNMVRRAVLLTGSGMVHIKSLPFEIALKNVNTLIPEGESDHIITDKTSLKSAAREAEYQTIKKILKQVNYNKTKAAEILNIDRKTLYNKLREFNLLKS
ncbi:MAG: sigma-54-dependent Fis family transcriptional regulator [Chitinophagales bacterium]|nr:sigma-54-dependent Fis family transcriptional regulator [Chitinophagales bacterium]